MAADEVRIERLRLRIPGIAPDEARRLGERVGALIAAGLPQDARHRELGAVTLRIEAPSGASPERLAQAIAARILEGLR